MEKLPKTIIIRITNEQYEFLSRYCMETGSTISEAIRDMLNLLMNNKKGE